jgi:hypothetical protein
MKHQGQRLNGAGKRERDPPACLLKELGEDFFSTALRKPTPADQTTARSQTHKFRDFAAAENFTL